MLAALFVFGVASASPPADLTALGVVVSSRPERSQVLLRSAGRTRVAAVGEQAFGGRVLGIALGAVSLDFGSGPVELRLEAGRAPLTLPAPTPAPATLADRLSRSMTRHDVERRLAEELPRILAETTLAPLSDEGRVTGFALTRLPAGTLLGEAGLRPGDVLSRINDVPIDSMATLLGLWPRLQTENTIRAVVLRGGQPVTLTVTLR
jgi:type II secretory pathway component PulC